MGEQKVIRAKFQYQYQHRQHEQSWMALSSQLKMYCSLIIIIFILKLLCIYNELYVCQCIVCSLLYGRLA